MTAKPAHIKAKTKIEHEARQDDELTQLTTAFLALYEEREDLRNREKEINKELDGYEDKETQIVHEGLQSRIGNLLEAKGFDLVRTGLGSFWPKPENHPSVSQDVMPDFLKFLDENGMGAIAKRTVHPQTLKGWVNDRLASNQPLPPEVNNVTKMKLGFRRK